MKKILLCLVIALMGFNSCSKDKENDEDYTSPQEKHLFGKWKLSKVETVRGTLGIDYFGCKPPVLVFEDEHATSATYYEDKCEPFTENGSWRLKGSELITDNQYTGMIIALSASQFTLEVWRQGIAINMIFSRI